MPAGEAAVIGRFMASWLVRQGRKLTQRHLRP